MDENIAVADETQQQATDQTDQNAADSFEDDAFKEALYAELGKDTQETQDTKETEDTESEEEPQEVEDEPKESPKEQDEPKQEEQAAVVEETPEVKPPEPNLYEDFIKTLAQSTNMTPDEFMVSVQKQLDDQKIQPRIEQISAQLVDEGMDEEKAQEWATMHATKEVETKKLQSKLEFYESKEFQEGIENKTFMQSATVLEGMFPDIKETFANGIPSEMSELMGAGLHPLPAYLVMERGRMKSEIAELTKQNEKYKKQNENKRRTTGSVKSSDTDKQIDEFRAEMRKYM